MVLAANRARHGCPQGNREPSFGRLRVGRFFAVAATMAGRSPGNAASIQIDRASRGVRLYRSDSRVEVRDGKKSSSSTRFISIVGGKGSSGQCELRFNSRYSPGVRIIQPRERVRRNGPASSRYSREYGTISASCEVFSRSAKAGERLRLRLRPVVLTEQRTADSSDR